MTKNPKITYERPRIEDIGSLVELTAKAKFADQAPALSTRTNGGGGSSSSDTTAASGPPTATGSGSW